MIEIKNLTKKYHNGNVDTHVLRGIDLSVTDGEFIAIMGRSGAGKSTLLYQMSLLDRPSGGSIVIDGHRAEDLTSETRTLFRLTRLGYVFQDYALIPELTALENVALPLLMQGMDVKSANAKATEALARVRLDTRINNLPSQLSGGEQQRVSISRAIAHKPKILFADEPTANLDNESSKTIMDIFLQLHKEGQTIIMVTHEEDYGKMAQKIVRLDDGKIVSIIENK